MLKRILIIQTAFPGDVILATSVLESLHQSNLEIRIDILVRQGNETLFNGHPFLHKILVWNKTSDKLFHLIKLISEIRKERYAMVINFQRFASSGLLTIFSGAKETRGFNKNPFSVFFSKQFKHTIGDGRHEIERNHDLIADISQSKPLIPRLYPQDIDFQQV